MPMSAMGKAAAGFTLLELLTALAVISLTLALAPMAFDRMAPRRQLDAQSQALASGLRDLRALAQLSGTVQSARLERGALWLGERRHALPEGIAVDGGALARVTFFPDGSSSGGDLLLTSAHGARQIVVRRATGRVQVAAP
jgi:general secretion pathway protein H